MDGAVPPLVVQSVSKAYGSVKVLEKISLEINSGEIVCVCGPNGAGKTTLLEIVQGSRRADDGNIKVMGHGVPLPSSVRSQVGVLFQDGGAPDKARVGELLHVMGSLFPKPRPAGAVLDAVGLGGLANQDLRKLSGGQRRRVLLAMALIGGPEVLLLDEPTSGLDPQSREQIWTAITDVAARGSAVMVTTHYLDEAEDYCDRVVLLVRGSVLLSGSPRRLLADRQLLYCCMFPDLVEARVRSLVSFKRSSAARVGGGRFGVFFASETDLEALVGEARTALGAASEIQVRPARLEDLLLLEGDVEVDSSGNAVGRDQ